MENWDLKKTQDDESTYLKQTAGPNLAACVGLMQAQQHPQPKKVKKKLFKYW